MVTGTEVAEADAAAGGDEDQVDVLTPGPPPGAGATGRPGPARWDVTAFCWNVRRVSGGRLRLTIHCFPKLARQLAAMLRQRTRESLRSTGGTVWTERPDAVCVLAEGLGGDPQLVRALHEYRAARVRLRRGVPATDETRQAVAAAVGKVIILTPAQFWDPLARE